MRILKEIIKFLFTILLFYLIFRKIPFSNVRMKLLSLDRTYLVLSFISFFIYYLFFSLRWSYLLDKTGIKISRIKSYTYILISFFFNNFLPSAVGQDFIRSAYASKNEFSKALGVSLMDRFLGFIGMLILGILAVLSKIHKIKVLSVLYFLLILLLFLLFYIFTAGNFGKGIKEKILRIKFLNFGDELRKFYNVLKDFKGRRIVLINGIILSIVIQGMITIINFFIFKSTGINISFFNLVVLLPAITILSLVPLTLNGLGLREFAYIYFFGLVNIKGEEALTISLLFFFISVIASLSGGILFLFIKREK